MNVKNAGNQKTESWKNGSQSRNATNEEKMYAITL